MPALPESLEKLIVDFNDISILEKILPINI
jgi:hypothetical protein